jgi:hypothetical protein
MIGIIIAIAIAMNARHASKPSAAARLLLPT